MCAGTQWRKAIGRARQGGSSRRVSGGGALALAATLPPGGKTAVGLGLARMWESAHALPDIASPSRSKGWRLYRRARGRTNGGGQMGRRRLRVHALINTHARSRQRGRWESEALFFVWGMSRRFNYAMGDARCTCESSCLRAALRGLIYRTKCYS